MLTSGLPCMMSCCAASELSGYTIGIKTSTNIVMKNATGTK